MSGYSSLSYSGAIWKVYIETSDLIFALKLKKWPFISLSAKRGRYLDLWL